MSMASVGTAMAASAAGAYVSKEMGGGGAPARRTRSLPPWAEPAARETLGRGVEAGRDMSFVPMDPAQDAALGRAEGFAEGFNPSQTAAFGGADLARRTMRGDFLSPDTNPALGATIDAATGQVIDDFNRRVLPQIGSQAQRAGAWGGSRQGLAEATAADEVTQNIGDISSRMLADAYGRERQLQTQAMQMAPTLTQGRIETGLAPSRILGEVGGRRRQFEQEEEGFDFGREQAIGDFISGLTRGQGTTTASREQPSDAVRMFRGGLGGLQLYNTAQEAFGNTGSPTQSWSPNYPTPRNPAMGR